MARNAILTAGLLLLAYSLFIVIFRPYIRRTAQIAEQRNIVKAEELLYENGEQADTIVIGSSMSNRLLFDNLPGHYYNMSLEGLAAVDGLWLISKTNHCPRLLLIEMNTLDRLPDTTFYASLAAFGRSQIKKYLPFMRLKYQPVGVVKALLRDWHDGSRPQSIEAIDTAFVTKIIQERLVRSKDIVEENKLHRTVGLVADYVQSFRRKGAQVVFFEMPTDPRIRNTKVSSRLRELVKEAFPHSTYPHIRFPEEFYQTTDGVHLPTFECVRYTKYLREQLKQTQSSVSLLSPKMTTAY